MKRTLALLGLLLVWSASTGQAVKDKFAGTWTLVVIERPDAAGGWSQATEPYGSTPVGYIIYDSQGHMAAQISGSDRPFFPAGGNDGVTDRTGDLDAATEDQLRAAIYGYAAYFGTYDVNEGEQSVTHHRLGHLIPNNVGRSVTRLYRFIDDRLILTLPDGSLRLTWRRVSP